MSLLLFYSDIHLHAFPAYNTLLPNGLSSRLADGLDCIAEIGEIAVNRAVDLIVFGGDLFHVRRHIAVSTFNAAHEALRQLHTTEIPTAMITGNHDQADRAGDVRSIHTLDNVTRIMAEPGWHTFNFRDADAVNIFVVPYIEDRKHIKEVMKMADSSPPAINGARIFLGHLGVQGAKVGSDFVYTNSADPTLEDLKPDAFDAGFLGHYHLPQELGHNFRYIGAPLQHNWGDAGQARGCYLYDTATKQSEFIPLNAPRFVEVEESQVAQLVPANNYLRVLTAKPWSESRCEELRVKLGMRSVESIPVEQAVSAVAPRIQMEKGTSMSDLVEKYVQLDTTDKEDLDPDYLVKLGQDLLTNSNAIS